MANTGQRVDPYRSFNFLVELDGIAQASFIECTGLSSTTEVIENREGGDNTTVRKLPGKTTYGDISLKWGLTSSRVLWDWRQQIIDGQVVRKNGAVVVFDLANVAEVARWSFFDAWPVKWEGQAFNARGNEISIDTLVLACEKVIRGMSSPAFRTEVEFELPKGLVDPDGTLHRRGVMRLATAADEIYPLKDPRVQAWPAYLIIILLSRVVTRLGTVPEVNPGVVERLFSEDLAHLQDLYNRVNGLGSRTLSMTCPHCGEVSEVEVTLLGG